MDTFYRHPEDSCKVTYGEWVVYTHPQKGDLLARVLDLINKPITKNKQPSGPYYRSPDTSYTYEDGVLKYAESFKCKISYTNMNSGVVKMDHVNSSKVRPMTEQENKDLEIFFERDLKKYPLILNCELLREAVTKSLKVNAAGKSLVFL